MRPIENPIEDARRTERVGPSTPLALPSQRTLDEITLLISCGSEMNTYRSIAVDVLHRLNHLLRFERRARYVIDQWDYQLDASRDEAPGRIADRSIGAVNDSEGVIAIIGPSVPAVTQREIRRVYELNQIGQDRYLWCFGAPGRRSRASGRVSRRALLEGIERDFGRLPIYHPVKNEMDFQASLIIDMIPFVVQRTGSAFGPLMTGARS